jgi:hypothetical protein
VRPQRRRHQRALVRSRRQDHHDEPSGADVLDVSAQVSRLFVDSGEPNQRTLEARQEFVLLADWVKTVKVNVAVKHVDCFGRDSGRAQCIDRLARAFPVVDSSNNSVGWIRDECRSSRWLHGGHFSSSLSARPGCLAAYLGELRRQSLSSSG